MELKGLEIFELEEKEALNFIKEFEILRRDKGDFIAMNYFIIKSRDFPFYYKNMMLNAWRSLIEMSKLLNEQAD
jgi:hypothetical protein